MLYWIQTELKPVVTEHLVAKDRNSRIQLCLCEPIVLQCDLPKNWLVIFVFFGLNVEIPHRLVNCLTKGCSLKNNIL